MLNMVLPEIFLEKISQDSGNGCRFYLHLEAQHERVNKVRLCYVLQMEHRCFSYHLVQMNYCYALFERHLEDTRGREFMNVNFFFLKNTTFRSIY